MHGGSAIALLVMEEGVWSSTDLTSITLTPTLSLTLQP